jgi:hypothetical protein
MVKQNNNKKKGIKGERWAKKGGESKSRAHRHAHRCHIYRKNDRGCDMYILIRPLLRQPLGYRVEISFMT